MNLNDQSSAASQLLRDSVDDLPVAVDLLVRGGISRGRAIRRRRRVGASLAAAVVVGAIGVAASVGPGMVGDERPDREPVGPAGTTGTDAAAPIREGRRALAVTLDEVPNTFAALLPGDLADDPETEVDDPTGARFLWDGYWVRVAFDRAELANGKPVGTPQSRCVLTDSFRTGCQALPGGAVVETEGPDNNMVDGIVSANQAKVYTPDGWTVLVTAGTQAYLGGPAQGPALTADQVLAAATSDVWFDETSLDPLTDAVSTRVRQDDARRITVSPEDVPDILGEAFGGEVGTILTTEGSEMVDEADRAIVHFLYGNTETTFVIERADTLASCEAMVDPADQPDGQPGGECVERDGLEVLLTGPETADGVTSSTAMAWQRGFVVSVVSTDGNGDAPLELSGTPALSQDELVQVATSPRWFSGS